ncbi:primase-helicase zinc-binding domain-containing protein [Sodalis glossinidius]|uniref:primase-helicase zinc-binding domain-containing protein n=1 Tax=Sodalis glossinidius TaxID=63612 RepID=UPI0003150593|nr:primase-helicase zinc-binding domain-containing protein [Sodalis glossinidius]
MGKTRYRFDDLEGRGTHYCSHCGAGKGLDLVMKVKQYTAPAAATVRPKAGGITWPVWSRGIRQ